METVINILTIVGIAIGVIGGAAAGVAFFKVNLAKSQIEALRGDRDDLEARVDRLTDTISEYKSTKLAQDVLIQQQNEKIKTLEKVVTGKEQLDHLQRQLDAHDRRVDERHETLSHSVGEIIDELRLLKGGVEVINDDNKEMHAAMLLVLQSGKRP